MPGADKSLFVFEVFIKDSDNRSYSVDRGSESTVSVHRDHTDGTSTWLFDLATTNFDDHGELLDEITDHLHGTGELPLSAEIHS